MPSASPHTRELERARQVEISVDLISLAKQELDFLKLVNDTPALKDPLVLERAICRYLSCWLPLASESSPTSKVQPPLDCAWVWHCHKLNPVQYAKDCQQLFRKLVDVPPTVPGQAGQVEEDTRTIWAMTYPGEPYHFIQAGQRLVEDSKLSSHLAVKNTIDYDLLAAVKRQQSFFFQVCRPWMYDDRYLRVSLARYRQFLFFIKLGLEKHSQGGAFVVPTYDIDLLWHSHQLCPTAYGIDTARSLGNILNHDDTDTSRTTGSKLQTSFADVCKEWVNVYGMVYEHAGSLYRGPEPSLPDPPSPVDTNPRDVVPGHSQSSAQHSQLTGRQAVQVNLVILGASNIHPASRKGRKSYFYVRISSLQSCLSMRLITVPKECSNPSTTIEWNEGCCLDAEVSTKGLRLELMSYTLDGHGGWERGFKKLQRKMPCLWRSRTSNCLGQAVITWERDLLNPTAELSLTRSIPMTAEPCEDSKGSSSDRDVPQLQLSVSTTTPIPAPFIFRIFQSTVAHATRAEVGETIPRNDRGTEVCWIRGSVLDHTGREQFVTWTRWTAGAQRHSDFEEKEPASGIVIDVHQAGLETQTQSATMGMQPKVMGSGKQVKLDHNGTCRRWTLLDGALELDVSKPVGLSAPLVCEVKGGSDRQLKIISGRQLNYEADARLLNQLGQEEKNYSTIVRYTKDAPLGKATALINWQCNAIEVMPGENVVLIMLIFSAVNVSLLHKNNDPTYFSPPLVSTNFMRQGSPDDHLGSVLLHQKGLSDRWIGTPSDQDLYWEQSSPPFLYYPWYTGYDHS